MSAPNAFVKNRLEDKDLGFVGKYSLCEHLRQLCSFSLTARDMLA